MWNHNAWAFHSVNFKLRKQVEAVGVIIMAQHKSLSVVFLLVLFQILVQQQVHCQNTSQPTTTTVIPNIGEPCQKPAQCGETCSKIIVSKKI